MLFQNTMTNSVKQVVVFLLLTARNAINDSIDSRGRSNGNHSESGGSVSLLIDHSVYIKEY